MAHMNADPVDDSNQSSKHRPQVTVVLAVKGAGEQALSNWRSQLVSGYEGQLEFIFCVESEADPAYAAISDLQREMQGKLLIRLVVAGLAKQCSQQIHNQLAGAKAASEESKYVLFLDDDIQCHPGSIGELVRAMEKQPEIFVCTGYSFDIPSAPSLAAYAAMAYRLPLLVGMSTGARAFFVWGGCIMVRAQDLRNDKHGMLTALKKNGYSNDLILTSIAGVNNRIVWCPAAAIFPGKMSGEWTMLRYWNYVRRQIFALLTYCSSFSFRTNRIGWVCYTYLSWAAVWPLILSALHVAYFCVSVGMDLMARFDQGGLAKVALTIPAGLSWSAWVQAHAMSPIGLALAVANFSCFALSTAACVRLFAAVIALCNLLSPQQKPFRLRDLSLFLGMAGMALNLFLLPVIAIYTYFKTDITWAGIRYETRNGVVVRVVHPGDDVELSSITIEKMSGKMARLMDEKQLLHTMLSRFIAGKGVPMKVDPAMKSFPVLGRPMSPEQKKMG